MGQERVSTIRSRDKVLEVLLPKLLGILSERGESDELPGSVRAPVGPNISLNAFSLGAHALAISIYAPTPREPIKKVLSLYLSPHPIYGFPYQQQRCSVLSWTRGAWEDRLMVDRSDPLPIEAKVTAGILAKVTNAALATILGTEVEEQVRPSTKVQLH